MKKRLTINSLALGNLKQRRKQYAIMIVGIILAMVFSSSTLFFMFSSVETYKAQQQKEQGIQSAIMYTEENDEKIYQDALEDGIIESYGFAYIIGFGYTDDVNFGTAVAWLDDKAMELSNQLIIDGAFPANGNEIAVEQTALLRLGIDAEIGSEITLKLMAQNGVNRMEAVDKTYTLTGILHDKKSNLVRTYGNASSDLFVPAALVAKDTQTEIGGRELLSAYITIDERPQNAWSNFYDYMQENSNEYNFIRQYEVHSFQAVNAISESGSYGFVIAAVLVIASCVAIVNAFNTNLKERKKQIGMLRAVGATKRQIIKIFGREALIISIICAPISIAISYGLVRLLISAISEEAVITKSIAVLPIIALICIAVTMFAAMIPLILASRISPMQAIRNTDISYKMRAKKIKSQKEFNVPSHLAKRSAALYKGGKIAVSIMLTIMILISYVGFTFIHEFAGNLGYNYSYDYELDRLGDSVYDGLEFYYYSGMSEADKRELEAYPYFSSIISGKLRSVILDIGKHDDYFYTVKGYSALDYNEKLTYDNFRDHVINNQFNDYKEFRERFGNGSDIINLDFYSFEEQLIRSIQDKVWDGKIDYGKLASGEEIILVAPKKIKWSVNMDSRYSGYASHYYYDNGPVSKDYTVMFEGECPYRAGDKITLSFIDYEHADDFSADPDNYSRDDKEVTIGAIVNSDDLRGGFYGMLGWADEFYMMTTHSGMSALSENTKYYTVQMSVDDNVEIDGDIDETITAFLRQFDNKYDASFTSTYALNKAEQRSMYSLFVSLISIITIGFVICGSIVNNSLTATIREKKKEIGTLRAVGADIGVLIKSYIRQLLSMFAYGYGIGFCGAGIFYIYLLISYFKDKSQGYDVAPPVFSPWETLIFCVILFAICSINLWTKVRKEMKNSIVENIKEL